MPIEIIQSNERVAEARSVCDCCGRLVGISIIPRKEAELQKYTKVMCTQCKRI